MANKPTESGWYHHNNGHGGEEIVRLEFEYCGFWIYKAGSEVSMPLDDDKGTFGDRVPLPSEIE